MVWGPKRETSLQISRLLAIPVNFITDHNERWRFQFLRHVFIPSWAYGLVQKALVAYELSSEYETLWLATCAWFDNCFPFDKRREEYIFRAVSALSKKPISALSEGDFCAVSFLALSTRWTNFDNSKSFKTRLPSPSLQLRMFMAIMQDLLWKSKGNIKYYALGEFWPYMSYNVLESLPLGNSGNTIWKFWSMCRQLFGPLQIEKMLQLSRRLVPEFCSDSAVESWHKEEAWYSVISLNFRVVMTGFSTVLSRQFSRKLKRPRLLRAAFEDVREQTLCLVSSELHMQIISSLPQRLQNSSRSHEMRFRVLGRRHILLGIYLTDITRLLLALVLDGPTIKQAVSSDEAISQARCVVYGVQRLFSVDLYANSYGSEIALLHLVVAALVYSISCIDEGSSVCPHFPRSCLLTSSRNGSYNPSAAWRTRSEYNDRTILGKCRTTFS